MDTRSEVQTSGLRQSARWPKTIFFVCIVLLLTMFFAPVRERVQRLEHWTADWRTVVLAHRAAGLREDILIVVIDESTFRGGLSNGPARDLMAKIISAVNAGEPAAIGLDYFFLNETAPEKDQALIDAIRSSGNTPFVPGAVDKHDTAFTAQEFAAQRKFLEAFGKPFGYVELNNDGDDVVRYTSPPVPGDVADSFASKLASLYLQKPIDPRKTRIAWQVRGWFDPNVFTVINADELFSPSGEMLDQATLAGKLKGKIVLIGGRLAYSDNHLTPFNIVGDPKMPGVLVHAQVLAQYLDGRFFKDVSGSALAALLAALTAVGLLLGYFSEKYQEFLRDSTIVTIALVLIDAILFKEFRIIVPFTLALWTWIISVTAGHHAGPAFRTGRPVEPEAEPASGR